MKKEQITNEISRLVNSYISITASTQDVSSEFIAEEDFENLKKSLVNYVIKKVNKVSDVFQRDSWTCQTCGIRGVYLEIHHIKSWAGYPDLRYELSNGVTLCQKCHKLTNNYKGKNNG